MIATNNEGVKDSNLKKNSNLNFDFILKIYFDGFPKKKWPLKEELILFMMHFQQVKLLTLFSIIRLPYHQFTLSIAEVHIGSLVSLFQCNLTFLINKPVSFCVSLCSVFTYYLAMFL